MKNKFLTKKIRFWKKKKNSNKRHNQIDSDVYLCWKSGVRGVLAFDVS